MEEEELWESDIYHSTEWDNDGEDKKNDGDADYNPADDEEDEEDKQDGDVDAAVQIGTRENPITLDAQGERVTVEETFHAQSRGAPHQEVRTLRWSLRGART